MEEVYHELGSNGGLKGISGVSSDMRDIIAEIKEFGPLAERCRLARVKYIYDILNYIGAYIIRMGGIDAICFTGGTGQGDADLRAKVLSSLEWLGFKLNPGANANNRECISYKNSTIAALVLKTNEEIVVARETVRVVENM